MNISKWSFESNNVGHTRLLSFSYYVTSHGAKWT